MPGGNFLSQEKLQQRLIELEKRNIRLISKFTKMHERHNFLCLIPHCGNIWTTSFNGVYITKTGCPKCNRNGESSKLSNEEVKLRLMKLKKRGIELITPFTKVDEIHSFRCLDINCGNKWDVKIKKVFEGSGCPKCAKKSIRLTDDEIKNRIRKLESRNIKLLNKFVTVKSRNNFLCLLPECGHVWNSVFDNVDRGRGCPKCAGRHLTSEEKVMAKRREEIRYKLKAVVKNGKINYKIYHNEPFLSEIAKHYAKEYAAFIVNNPEPENRKVITLDHIIPCSWWDFEDMEQLKLCWSKENFQWLPHYENSSKRNNIRPEDIAKFTSWHWEALKKCSYPKKLPT